MTAPVDAQLAEQAKRTSRRGRRPTPSNEVYFNLEDAAERLGTTKGALKKYLSRHQRRDGRDTVCTLGDGVRAVKVRGIWRVRFDGAESKS